jgi:hypothetical protein
VGGKDYGRPEFCRGEIREGKSDEDHITGSESRRHRGLVQ